jgi:predicted DCC family thiol-disulfide oxidoreductase YuxK
MSDAMRAACKRSVHVVRANGEVLRAGRATLFILEQVGWGVFARILSWPPFVWFVELAYWFVARNRRFVAKFMFTEERPPPPET